MKSVRAESRAGAPRTALAGAHARTVATLIERAGPRCEVLRDLDALERVAQLKMVWSAALWLVCNARECCVDEAHEAHADELRQRRGELPLSVVLCCP